MQWCNTVLTHWVEVELSGTLPQGVSSCHCCQDSCPTFGIHFGVKQLKFLSSHSQPVLTVDFVLLVAPEMSVYCWHPCHMTSETPAVLWCVALCQACTAEVEKVVTLSEEEHLQPFKDKMEDFLSQGRAAVEWTHGTIAHLSLFSPCLAYVATHFSCKRWFKVHWNHAFYFIGWPKGKLVWL